jgi:hypothetical protein
MRASFLPEIYLSIYLSIYLLRSWLRRRRDRNWSHPLIDSVRGNRASADTHRFGMDAALTHARGPEKDEL